MGRSANDKGKRPPDSGKSNKKFDTNRQLKEQTGKFSYVSGKKERDRIKQGHANLVPRVNIFIAVVVVTVVSLLIGFLVYFFATVED